MSDEEGLLKSRVKTAEERLAEEEDYAGWLENEEKLNNKGKKEELQPLRRFWTDSNLSETDQFLRDYIVSTGRICEV